MPTCLEKGFSYSLSKVSMGLSLWQRRDTTLEVNRNVVKRYLPRKLDEQCEWTVKLDHLDGVGKKRDKFSS